MIENYKLYPKNRKKTLFLVVHDKNRTSHYILGYTFIFYDTLILKTRFYIQGEKCIYEKDFLKKLMVPVLVDFFVITPIAHVPAAEFIVKDQNPPNN